MFSLKSELIVKIPKDVLIIAIPLLLYFALMFFFGFFFSKVMGAEYDKTAAIAVTIVLNCLMAFTVQIRDVLDIA